MVTKWTRSYVEGLADDHWWWLCFFVEIVEVEDVKEEEVTEEQSSAPPQSNVKEEVPQPDQVLGLTQPMLYQILTCTEIKIKFRSFYLVMKEL